MDFASFDEFWPHYLREHARPLTRTLHALGIGVALLMFIALLLFGHWWLLLFMLVAGYGFAWASHLIVEHNRPATFSHPLWSLRADLRMAWLMVTGRLTPELRRAGV
jgi:hypothetical protein